MNIHQAAAIMGKKGGESGTGDSKRRPIEFYRKMSKDRWGHDTKSPMDRFWEKVQKKGPNECWLFTACDNGHGYGAFRFDGRATPAHRVAWIMTNGHVPKGLDVCHHCDVRRCCNPSHLYVGTRLDNMRDASKRKRFPDRRGEKGNIAILTNAQALEIRRDYLPYRVSRRSLAEKYGVSLATIYDVVARRSFRHI